MSLASAITISGSAFLKAPHSLNLVTSSSESGIKSPSSSSSQVSFSQSCQHGGGIPAALQCTEADIKTPVIDHHSSNTNNIGNSYIDRFPNGPLLAVFSPTHTSPQVRLNEFANSAGARSVEQQQQMCSEDETRAYKLALELSMVGLDDRPNASRSLAMVEQVLHMQNPNQPQPEYTLDSLRAISAAVAAVAQSTNACNPNMMSLKESTRRNGFPDSDVPLPSLEDRTKKSQNMTECVPVPSSEHVAEIVGRQGCKIKALRTKTNTYIKTPVRGEEPVFVVTGRKEDVAKAKREIISAAEHFSFIRASRRPLADGNCVNGPESNFLDCGGGVNRVLPKGPTSAGPALPGQITIKVRVPYRVVGLVVGPKGATIKHIQQETQTYIITPSRDKEPVFEVTGLPDNVQSARQQIESHIALRTGNLQAESPIPPASDVVTISQIFNEEINSDFLASLYRNGMFDYVVNPENGRSGMSPIAATSTNAINKTSNMQQQLPKMQTTATNNMQMLNALQNSEYINNVISANQMGHAIDHENVHQLPHKLNFTNCHEEKLNDINMGSGGQKANETQSYLQGAIRSCSSASSTTSSKSTNCSRPELVNIWKGVGGGDSADVDEGIGESPNIWKLPASLSALTGANSSPSTSISPTDSLLGEMSSANYNFNQIAATQHDTTIQKMLEFSRRECLICNNKKVTAALVPCGHNMFCMECANTICSSTDATCPICNLPVYQAMRIFP